VGPFKADDMVDLDALEALAAEGRAQLGTRLVAPDIALAGLPEVRTGTDAVARFRSGQTISVDASGAWGLVRVYAKSGEFLGVGEVSEGGYIRPRRVFLRTEENS
jgi:tRNA pseudouridine55 synthase